MYTMSNTGTTGRIPLWLVGTLIGSAALALGALAYKVTIAAQLRFGVDVSASTFFAFYLGSYATQVECKTSKLSNYTKKEVAAPAAELRSAIRTPRAFAESSRLFSSAKHALNFCVQNFVTFAMPPLGACRASLCSET
ncbi:hypothetical protein IEQ34_025259 [Dendrobium chrysotoxum]|uniref:Uncharacterized protein n=1 Tax=Dendrobium chrysotoxum TaxID=161865 RepID=A0AAV7FQ94_DENCH|nr:hypothetical protein IEQ34_025259 [Dendrobium chrysotoxum]